MIRFKKLGTTVLFIALSFGISTLSFAKFLDLSPYANHDGEEGLSQPYTNLPREEIIVSLRNSTKFKIYEGDEDKIFIVLSGNWLSGYPESVYINFQDFARTIHFFGHIHYGRPNNEVIGKYVVHFEDSSTREILLDSNESSEQWNTDDHCCHWRAKDLTQADLAWEDSTQPEKGSLLREFIWENPTPETKIARIEFTSLNTSVNPVLSAITYFIPVSCPLSTALQGAPEKGTALDLVYRFRDEVMAQSSEGQQYIRQYYHHAWEGSWLLLWDLDLRTQARDVLEQNLPTIEAVVEGQPATLTAEDMGAIEDLLDDVETRASLGLQRTIRHFRGDLHRGQLLSLFGIEVEAAR